MQGLCIVLVVLLLLVHEVYFFFKRYFLTKIKFQKAKKLSEKKNKKLMVIGDPCTGNVNMWIQKRFPNCEHGDVTIDLFGCEKCDRMDVNDFYEWQKYRSNEYVIFETGTLSFGKDIKKILSEIKRISGGDFFSAGGTTSIGWKYFGHKNYSKKYPDSLQNIIYPFDSHKDKYYMFYNFKQKQIGKICWEDL